MFEQLVDFLKSNDGSLPRGCIRKIETEEMTRDEKDEIQLYAKWRKSKEKEIFEAYIGRPIEEVPEAYREKVAILREYGIITRKIKIQQAKQQRDEAKIKNDKAKELEQQVSEELKKRGKNHEEQ